MATKKKKRAPKAAPTTNKKTTAKAPARGKKRERLVDSFTGLFAGEKVEDELVRAEHAEADALRLRALFRRGYIFRERSPEAWIRSEANRYRQEIEFGITEPLIPASLIGGRFRLKDNDYAREFTDLGYAEIVILGERGRYTSLDYSNEGNPRVSCVSRDVMMLVYSKDEDHWSLMPHDPAGFFDELYEFYDIVSLPGVPHALEFKPSSTQTPEWYAKRKAEADAKAQAEAAHRSVVRIFAEADAKAQAETDAKVEADAKAKEETDDVR